MSTATNPHRKRLLLLAVVGTFAIAGIAYLAYWLTVARYVEATEDAYVSGNMVQITPQVAGTTIAIAADDTQFVRAGQLLVQLDRASPRAALLRDEATLGQTVREIRNLFAQTSQLRAAVVARQVELSKAEADLKRRERLASSGAVSNEDVQHARDAADEIEPVRLRRPRDPDERNGRRRREQHTVSFRRAEVAFVEELGDVRAHEDLARLRCVFHLDGVRGVRPADDQLAVMRARKEEVEGARVDAHVHLELGRADRRGQCADCAEAVAHAPGRGAGAPRVLVAVEEEKECVAAELHEAAAVRVRDREQLPERRAHHVGHLFGAEAALRREPLRHRGVTVHVAK